MKPCIKVVLILDKLHNLIQQRCSLSETNSMALMTTRLVENYMKECTRRFCLVNNIYSQLSRCCTARGFSKGFSQVSPAKVEAHKCFLIAESFLVLKIKNIWLILLLHFILTSLCF